MSLFKSPMQQVTSTQQPTTIVDQQQQQQIEGDQQPAMVLPQGPLITSNLESPTITTTAPVTTKETSNTTTTPDPTNIENFPTYDIKLHDFNVWDQTQPLYPEFSHQQAQAPVNPDQDKEKEENNDADTDVLPVDPLPGFPSSSMHYVQTTSPPPVTRTQLGTTTVSAASLLAKLYNNNKTPEPVVNTSTTSTANGNSADATVKNTLDSIDGPSLGTGVLKPSQFVKDGQTESFTNTNLEDNSAPLGEVSNTNNTEPSVKEETPTTIPGPAFGGPIVDSLPPITQPQPPTTSIPSNTQTEQHFTTQSQPTTTPIPFDTTTQQPTQPPTTQPQQPTTPGPPQTLPSNVLQESSTVESIQNENEGRDVGQTPPQNDNNNNGLNLQQPPAPTTIETQPPITLATEPPKTPVTEQPTTPATGQPTTPATSQPPTTVPQDSPPVQSSAGINFFHSSI